MHVPRGLSLWISEVVEIVMMSLNTNVSFISTIEELAWMSSDGLALELSDDPELSKDALSTE